MGYPGNSPKHEFLEPPARYGLEVNTGRLGKVKSTKKDSDGR